MGKCLLKESSSTTWASAYLLNESETTAGEIMTEEVDLTPDQSMVARPNV
jgi:hypothetical protein